MDKVRNDPPAGSSEAAPKPRPRPTAEIRPRRITRAGWAFVAAMLAAAALWALVIWGAVFIAGHAPPVR